MNAPARSFAEVVEDQARIMGRGILSNRLMCLFGLGLSILVLLFAISMSVWTDELNTVDATLLGVLMTCFIAVGYLFFVADERQIYRAHVLLAYLVCIINLALIANALFGERVNVVTADSMPYVLVYLSIIVLFLFSILTPLRAWVFTLLLVFTGGGLVILAVITTEGQSISPALFWTLVCTTLLPLHTALMCQVNFHNQVEVVAAETRMRAREEIDTGQHSRDEGHDSVTGGLNEAGARRQLHADMEQHAAISLALISFPDHMEWRTLKTYREISADLRRLSSHVSSLLGPGARWGRLRDAKFVLWTTSSADGENLKQAIKKFSDEFYLPTRIHYGVVSRQEMSGERTRDKGYELILEADHRLFMNSLEEG